MEIALVCHKIEVKLIVFIEHNSEHDLLETKLCVQHKLP